MREPSRSPRVSNWTHRKVPLVLPSVLSILILLPLSGCEFLRGLFPFQESASQSDSTPKAEGGDATETSPSSTTTSTEPWNTRTLDSFRENPSDRFVVDPENVYGGHPYLGSRTPPSAAGGPHNGAHLTYRVDTWPRGGSAPENYPAIYAVADAKILDVVTWWGMGPPDPYCRDLNEYQGGQYEPCDNHPDERCGDIRNLSCPSGNSDPEACTSSAPCSVNYVHYKYDIMTQIGFQNGDPVTFSYSIEPFVIPTDPATGAVDPHFYEPFIKVKAGQSVHKGDIIAYHYLKAGAPGAENAHIHYQINRFLTGGVQSFASPSIFSSSIVEALRPTWNVGGYFHAEAMPGGIAPCMGVFLGATEVPFPSLDPDGDGEDCQ